jgi:hypothetical protein
MPLYHNLDCLDLAIFPATKLVLSTGKNAQYVFVEVKYELNFFQSLPVMVHPHLIPAFPHYLHFLAYSNFSAIFTREAG